MSEAKLDYNLYQINLKHFILITNVKKNMKLKNKPT